MREKKVSLRNSSFSTFWGRIKDYGWESEFRAIKSPAEITHQNGSLCVFEGMSDITADNLRSYHDFDIFWFEEASAMSHRSWELLVPTARKCHCEIIISFNPQYRYQVAWELVEKFQQQPKPGRRLVFQCHWSKNRFFTENNEADRLEMLEENPERYKHIWEGEPDDGGASRKILPYAKLLKCLRKLPDEIDGYTHAGLDVAREGDNQNALVIRKGAWILHYERWSGAELGETARRALAVCVQYNVSRLYVDETGVGSGVVSHLGDLDKENKLPFTVIGIKFGSKPAKPKMLWGMQGTRSIYQKDHYAKRNAQLADAVRIRLYATIAHLNGKDVDDEDCLWINKNIRFVRDLLVQMSQPEEEEDGSGRMKVEKQPKTEGSTTVPPSPDLYDGTVLAYAADSTWGLKRSNWIVQ